MSKVTRKQIEEWKTEYPDGIYELPVEDKTAYLRSPKMADFKRAFSAMRVDGDVGYGEELLKSLFIGGDDDVLNTDAYFLPARKSLVRLFEYADAEITSAPGGTVKITIGDNSCILKQVSREHLKKSEKKNPANKPFVTQEKLFEIIKVSATDAFDDKNNPEIRMPLYAAIETIQNQKVSSIKKL